MIKKIKDLNIKLAIYFLISNLLLVLLVGSIFYISSINTLINKEIISKTETIEKSGNYIELYINKLKALSQVISNDEAVYNFVNHEENIQIEKRILNMINNTIKADENIKSIILIRKDGSVISNENKLNMEISNDMLKEDWYVNSLKDSMPVLNPLRKQSFNEGNIENWVISISKDITDKNGNNLGVLLIDIKYSALNEFIQVKDSGDSVVLDNFNHIVYYKDIPKTKEKIEYLMKLRNLKEGYNRIDNKVIVKYPIKGTNWTLIETKYMYETLNLKRHFFGLIMLSSIISLIITILISIMLFRRVTKPIKELEYHMNNFNSNMDKIELNGDLSNEIISLQNHFNDMIKKIKYLREYEINALHSQINPHFLYNTLETIIWMAEFKDTEKVISMTKALSNFFRISLSNGKEKIPLRDEIKHIQDYLYIQKQRYEDKLEYIIDIDEKLLDIDVPKIILQPLVENSIYHGIKNLEKNGILKVYSIINEDYFELVVEDNGVGAKKSKENKLKKLGGVGQNNVDRRIKYYYGNDYGIKIYNVENGFKISVKLPFNM